MERRVNFLLIGVLFFIIFAAFVIFIIIMGRFSFDDKDYRYYRIYTQNEISGLGINTPVRYKGISIGSISSIGFDEKQFGVVKIVVKIKKKIPIRKNSSLVMDSQGLAGISYLSLKQSPKGDFITNDQDAVLKFEPNFLGKLSQKADKASQEILDVIQNLKGLVNENNVKNISHIISSIDILSSNLKSTQSNINELTKNINTLVSNLNQQVANGDYNIREVINPLMIRLNTSLNYMDQFFKQGNNVLDKFQKDPYNTIFGEQKK